MRKDIKALNEAYEQINRLNSSTDVSSLDDDQLRELSDQLYNEWKAAPRELKNEILTKLHRVGVELSNRTSDDTTSLFKDNEDDHDYSSGEYDKGWE